MTRLSMKLVGLSLAALSLVAAVPYQENPLSAFPWWVWLVLVSVLLLLFFVVIVAIDWSSSGESELNENE